MAKPAPKASPGKLSVIEQALQASDMMAQTDPRAAVARPILKTIASMLGTYNPDSDRIEFGLRPGIIDDIIGIPSSIDDISALLGHGTHMSGDISKTAAALSDASARRRNFVSPSRGKVDSAIQGVSDVMVSVPGSQPAKMGKIARVATAIPRAIYDTVVPVMDMSTKVGKGVAVGSSGLGAGLGVMGYDPEGEEESPDFYASLADKLNPKPQEDYAMVDTLIARAQAGDRSAYEQLKIMFPGEMK
jgi:hypothetical protein